MIISTKSSRVVSQSFQSFRLCGKHHKRNATIRNISSQTDPASLIVTPTHSLVDTPCTILGRNLGAESTVTLTTNLKNDEERFDFTSINRFRINSSGLLDTAEQAPLDGGSYSGVNPMGPFWSMQPKAETRTRLWPYDITAPLTYHLTLSDQNDKIIAATQVTKTYMAEGVERIEVKEGRIRGTLFLPPPHLRPYPAIITLYGGVNRGKVVEDRSALLASRGYASLALAYFAVEDLPKFYSNIDIEYFEEAVDFVGCHPDVDVEGGVGVFGASMGGDVAMAMAACLGNKIKAVAVSGAPFVGGVDSRIRYKGELLMEPYAQEDWTYDYEPPYIYMKGLAKEALEDTTKHLKFSKSSADLLVIQGDEDPALPSKTFSRECLERAKMEGKDNWSMVTFPGLGHLVDLPYSPVCLAQGTAHPLAPPGTLLYYGGHRQPHALAQITAWQTMLQFFKNTM